MSDTSRDCAEANPQALPTHPRVIGVVGGMGSGKSEVARRLAEKGATLIDVDQIGHAVLEEPQVKKALAERWGRGVFLPDGRVNRAAIARLVFGPSPTAERERRFLEALVHPRISNRLSEMLDECSRQPQFETIVLDAALLIEAGWDRFCDVVLFVEAPAEQRRQRAARRGWSEEQWQAREAAQLPLPQKRERANVVFTNDSTLEDLQQQVDSWWQVWQSQSWRPQPPPTSNLSKNR